MQVHSKVPGIRLETYIQMSTDDYQVANLIYQQQNFKSDETKVGLAEGFYCGFVDLKRCLVHLLIFHQ